MSLAGVMAGLENSRPPVSERNKTVAGPAWECGLGGAMMVRSGGNCGGSVAVV